MRRTPDPRLAAPLLHRRGEHRRARSRTPRPHHRGLAGAAPRVLHRRRRFERAHRGGEPTHQTDQTGRLRLPQLRELPAPPAPARRRVMAGFLDTADADPLTTVGGAEPDYPAAGPGRNSCSTRTSDSPSFTPDRRPPTTKDRKPRQTRRSTTTNRARHHARRANRANRRSRKIEARGWVVARLGEMGGRPLRIPACTSRRGSRHAASTFRGWRSAWPVPSTRQRAHQVRPRQRRWPQAPPPGTGHRNSWPGSCHRGQPRSERRRPERLPADGHGGRR